MKARGRQKYSAQPEMVDGFRFASKKEANRYRQLRVMQTAGVICSLTLQPRYKLEVGGVPIRYANKRQVTYVADFEYYDTERARLVIEDVKGVRTPVYKLKKAIMAAMGMEIEEI